MVDRLVASAALLRHKESQAAASGMSLGVKITPERKIMEYLVVLATATMIAVYAIIIARSLPKT